MKLLTPLAERVAVDIAWAGPADLGEGPIWDGRTGELVWLDITRQLVHRLEPSTGRDRQIDVGQEVGAVGLRSSGGLIGALRDGFALIADDGRCELVTDTERDRADTRMNDGKVDPAGRFWAGTMAFDTREGAGTLYRLGRGYQVEPVLTGLTISNGMEWSADRRLMYFIDSPTCRVDAFDYDDPTGAIRGRRPLCEIAIDGAVPDGMTVDAEGALWVAAWGGSCVLRFTPDGTPAGAIRLPASQVTSCAFGGRDLRDLYITTASRGLDAAQRSREPLAGALFVCRPGPRGREPSMFLG